MITKDNLKFCFDSLNESEIKKVMDSRKDYVSFWLHIFNTGSFRGISPIIRQISLSPNSSKISFTFRNRCRIGKVKFPAVRSDVPKIGWRINGII